MSESEETLKQEDSAVLKAIGELSKRIDGLEKTMNAQFEAIREGIVHNDARFDRLEGNFYLLRSQLTILTEEIRLMKKEPVA